jgi:hypothetical protein
MSGLKLADIIFDGREPRFFASTQCHGCVSAGEALTLL